MEIHLNTFLYLSSTCEINMAEIKLFNVSIPYTNNLTVIKNAHISQILAVVTNLLNSFPQTKSMYRRTN
jgi:hypothetical protein